MGQRRPAEGLGALSAAVRVQDLLKEINPGISLEGMMLKLKLRYFGQKS